jgi:hypothetical protein
MTEHEALTLAKWYVEKAQGALRAYEDGSYAMDAAYSNLEDALAVLVADLEFVTPEGLYAPPVEWQPSQPASEVYAEPAPEADGLDIGEWNPLSPYNLRTPTLDTGVWDPLSQGEG